jgi:hypothetical protein
MHSEGDGIGSTATSSVVASHLLSGRRASLAPQGLRDRQARNVWARNRRYVEEWRAMMAKYLFPFQYGKSYQMWFAPALLFTQFDTVTSGFRNYRGLWPACAGRQGMLPGHTANLLEGLRSAAAPSGAGPRRSKQAARLVQQQLRRAPQSFASR